jgi:tetratricopeptide (TPR) repeat protein
MALADLNIALTITPDSPRGHFLRGNIFALQTRHDATVADFKKALGQGALVDAEINAALARSYIALENYSGAIDATTLVINDRPTDSDARYVRALAYLLSYRYAAALQDVNVALDKTPDSVEALSLRAAIYMNLHRWEDARLDLEQAYTLDNQYIKALYGMAQAQFALGNYKAARENLTKYLDLSTPNSSGYAEAQVLLSLIDRINASSAQP